MHTAVLPSVLCPFSAETGDRGDKAVNAYLSGMEDGTQAESRTLDDTCSAYLEFGIKRARFANIGQEKGQGAFSAS